MSIVAFRKEGVDWNDLFGVEATRQVVAFRKEGVDWNNRYIAFPLKLYSRLPQGRCGLKYLHSLIAGRTLKSPSARKVGIEIQHLLD